MISMIAIQRCVQDRVLRESAEYAEPAPRLAHIAAAERAGRSYRLLRHLDLSISASAPPGRGKTSSASILPGSALDVAISEFPSVPCGGLGSEASVAVASTSAIDATNSVRRPAKQTAAVVGVQPPSDAAAVEQFSSAFIGA
jgi:hypothetical protein